MAVMTATEHETKRATIESEFNGLRDAIEKQYISDRNDLEDAYHADLAANKAAREAAYKAVGLNLDGSEPYGRPSDNQDPPVNTVAPAITGTATTGNTLTCSHGTWTGPADTYTYQWMRDGVPITNATAATRVVAGADVGHALKCRVTAFNEDGSAFHDSNTVTPAS
jgi:hypothetical protein